MKLVVKQVIKLVIKLRKDILMLVAAASSVVYIAWRIFFTIPTANGVVSLIVGLALVIAETIGVIEAFNHFHNMRASEIPELPVIPVEMYPDIDVFIATHIESTELLYKTVNGCKHMDYPDTSKVHIYLCDDNDRPEMRALAEKMGVGYFGLSGNTLAKAGNLNNALSKTDSPLVATFDSDMIPMRTFLIDTVPYFFMPQMIKGKDGTWRIRTESETDPNYKIGFIQTPQSFYNADMFQMNLFAENNIPNEQDYFFREVNVSRNRTQSPIYAGSNTVLSRKAIEEAGFIKTGTITEDFATGLEIQKRGYACYALPQALAHGLAPTSFKALIQQRQRWGRGCVQTLRSPKFLFSKELSFGAKMSYFACLLYWWTFLRRFIYILSPILFSVFGVVVVKTSFWELILIWMPSYLIYNHALKVFSGNLRNQKWSNIVDTILFPYLIMPIFLETFGIKLSEFHVTSKNNVNSKNTSIKFAVPHIMLLLATLVGLGCCIYDIMVTKSYGAVIIIYWLLLNGYYLSMSVMFMIGRINIRSSERFRAEVAIRIDTKYYTLTGITYDLSESGLAVKLCHPEYIPYDEDVSVCVEHEGFSANFRGRVMRVHKSKNGWIYSMRITETSDEDKASYFQIVYGREHTLAKKIESNLKKDITSAVNGYITKHHEQYRRLPRTPVNALALSDYGELLMQDFNFEYIRLGQLQPEAEGKIITLQLPQNLKLKCTPVKNSPGLYHIFNWQTIACDERLKTFLLDNSKNMNETDGESSVKETIAV